MLCVFCFLCKRPKKPIFTESFNRSFWNIYISILCGYYLFEIETLSEYISNGEQLMWIISKIRNALFYRTKSIHTKGNDHEQHLKCIPITDCDLWNDFELTINYGLFFFKFFSFTEYEMIKKRSCWQNNQWCSA